MTVQLALYKGKGDIANAAIRLWTGSEYSHCELVVDGMCYSSSVMDKGVRRKRIALKPEKWDLIELPWASAGYVKAYFTLTDHYRYGWLSLATSQLFNLNRPVGDAQFCSEWCAQALRIPSASIYNPDALGQLCEYVGGVTNAFFRDTI
jgi:hypothetical protein